MRRPGHHVGLVTPLVAERDDDVRLTPGVRGSEDRFGGVGSRVHSRQDLGTQVRDLGPNQFSGAVCSSSTVSDPTFFQTTIRVRDPRDLMVYVRQTAVELSQRLVNVKPLLTRYIYPTSVFPLLTTSDVRRDDGAAQPAECSAGGSDSDRNEVRRHRPRN